MVRWRIVLYAIVIASILQVLLLGILFPLPQVTRDNVNRALSLQGPLIDYYAYGDSITRATGFPEELDPDGSDAYILQMADLYDPWAFTLHNMDGGGMDSSWGAQNLPSHYIGSTRYFFYMFTNDGQAGLPDNQTAGNYIAIYRYVRGNGTVPVPCIPPLTSRPDTPWYDRKDQVRRIHALEAALEKEGIPYLAMYDALDSRPFNYRLDEPDTTFMPDGVHPDREGQRRMAVYAWYELRRFRTLPDMGELAGRWPGGGSPFRPVLHCPWNLQYLLEHDVVTGEPMVSGYLPRCITG